MIVLLLASSTRVSAFRTTTTTVSARSALVWSSSSWSRRLLYAPPNRRFRSPKGGRTTATATTLCLAPPRRRASVLAASAPAGHEGPENSLCPTIVKDTSPAHHRLDGNDSAHDASFYAETYGIHAPFAPMGDQPVAIRELVQQLQTPPLTTDRHSRDDDDDEIDQVDLTAGKCPAFSNTNLSILQGLTGTGKTFVMAHVAARLRPRAVLVLCHNKTLAAQLARELQQFLGGKNSKNARVPQHRVELFISFYNQYIPEAYNEVRDRYSEKKAVVNQDINILRHRATRAIVEQLHAGPGGEQTPAMVVVVASVSCMFGLGLPESYLNARVDYKIGGGNNNHDDDDDDDAELVEDPLQVLQDKLHYRMVTKDDDFQPGTFQHSVVASHAPESHRDDPPMKTSNASLVENEPRENPVVHATTTNPTNAILHKIVMWPSHEKFPLQVQYLERSQTPNGSKFSDETRFKVCSISQGTANGWNEISSVTIFPAHHHVVPNDDVEQVYEAIETEMRERVEYFHSQNQPERAQRLEQRVVQDLYMLRETGRCSGIENYSRHLERREAGQPPQTLLEYMSYQQKRDTVGDAPDLDWLLVVDESHVTLPQLRAMYNGDQARKRKLVEYGFRLPSALDNRPLTEEEFWQRVPRALLVSATPGKRELGWLRSLRFASSSDTPAHVMSRAPVSLFIRPTFIPDPVMHVRSPRNPLTDLVKEIQARVAKQERTLVITLTKRDAEDLSTYLKEQESCSENDQKRSGKLFPTGNIRADYIHSGLATDERSAAIRALQTGELDCLVGVNCLREGLDLPQVSLVAVLKADAEGFLRSSSALLQMAGRSARHKDGTVIFYAQRVTESLQICLEESRRRRIMQLEYNRIHNKEPKSTKGSSMLSIFDILHDQIQAEHANYAASTEQTQGNRQSDMVQREASTEGKFVKSGIGQPHDQIDTDCIPSSPGVYLWKDENESILYIGKAVKLRTRIKSYFNTGKHSPRIRRMVEKAKSVDFLLTPSERDALVLESKLIKLHQPMFNVLLKDDNHYPYIRASIGDSLPTFSVVPHVPDNAGTKGKYRYFGPYTSFKEMNKILEKVDEKYDLRQKSFLVRNGDGCRKEYHDLFKMALDDIFSSSSRNDLSQKRQEYEEAGLLFDSSYNSCRDVVGISPFGAQLSDLTPTQAILQVVQLRHGCVAGRFTYKCEVPSGIVSKDDLADSIQTILETRHYPAGREMLDPNMPWFPEEVLLPIAISDISSLKRKIHQMRTAIETKGSKKAVAIVTPAAKGERAAVDARVMQFIEDNLQELVQREQLRTSADVPLTSLDGTAAGELAKMLSLCEPPSRIECYDISHTQGEFAVGSRVVFLDGKPAPHLYRLFNIRTVEGVDDYASLTEVLERRFRQRKTQNVVSDVWETPDLIVIDGGQGQLESAIRGIENASSVFSGEKIPICSIAKSQEQVFVQGCKEPVNDCPNSPALLLLRHLRDEAHRFALFAHRKRRSLKRSTTRA